LATVAWLAFLDVLSSSLHLSFVLSSPVEPTTDVIKESKAEVSGANGSDSLRGTPEQSLGLAPSHNSEKGR